MTEQLDVSSLSGDQKRALLANLLKERARATVVESPLSYGQRALWFLYQLAPESPAYNISLSLRIRSHVDVEALRRAFASLMHRHASLRASFKSDGGQPLQVTGAYVDVPFAAVDVSGATDDELQRLALESHRRPFDLTVPPLCRVALFTRTASDHVLLLTTHHLVFDGWSTGIVLEELQACYRQEVNGTPASVPDVRATYQDFVEWQARRLAGDEGAALRDYWTSQLAPPLPTLELPTDHPRPTRQSFRGGVCHFELDSELAGALRELARNEQTTLFALLLAACYVVLYRYSGQEDISIGSPTAGRSLAEFERVVGYFVNPIVLRVNLAGEPSFRELLQRVRRVVQGGLAHQDYPFPLLVEQLHPERDPGRSPLFQVMFNLMRAQWLGGAAAGGPDAGGNGRHGLAFEPYSLPQEEGQFDLAFDMVDADQRLGGMLRYNSDLFEAETAQRIARHFCALLEAVVREPERPVSELSLIGESEHRKALSEAAETVRSYPAVTAAQLFERQAEQTPAASAVSDGARFLTYGELNARANQLARHLRGRGVTADTLVGIGMDRSVDLEVALLGVMKSGAAYVPLDPAYPAQRLADMIGDAQVRVLLTNASRLDRWTEAAPSAEVICVDRDAGPIAAESADNLPPGRPDDLAYVIYTSGSTGRPKGVEIPHRALTNFLLSMQETPGIRSSDVLVAVTTLSFDIAGLELLLPLTVGARVVIAGRDQTIDGGKLGELVETEKATIMQATPATWRLLLASGWRGRPGLKILCGGEALPRDLADELLSRCGELWNMYGPTETTIWSAVGRVEPGAAPIALGRPIANTQLYLADRHGQRLLLAGVPGEIYIGGHGVARGYRHRPELTAERFVADSFGETGGRLYRTGDLARYLPDGRIAFLGRIDDQVKLRGHRIELGEIESTLVVHPAVAQAVAAVHGDTAGDQRIVAYVVHHPGEGPTSSELRKFLRARLPDYMVPSLFVPIDTVPLTSNNKVNRRALPNPYGAVLTARTRVAPRTPAEEAVAEIWKQALGTSDVSVYDNFFEIGGHSLLSMRVIAQIEEQLGVRIEPARFMVDTLEQLAALCERERAQAAQPSPAADQRSGGLLQSLKARLRT